MDNGLVIIACSEIPFGGDSYPIEISQFISIPNQNDWCLYFATFF